MQRQHREGVHTGEESKHVIRDLEVKYESHRDMSFSEGSAIQVTELSLELKSVLLVKN